MKRKVLKSILCSLLIVALLSAPMSALAASKAAYILRVYTTDSSRKVYVRSGSSLRGGNGNSGILGTLKSGTRVLYWGEKSGQMCKIMTNGGAIGYIYQGNLKVYGAMNRKQIYFTNSSTGVYRASGSSIRKVGTIGKNKPVFVYGLRGGYALCKNLAGATGYIKASALKKSL